tara:strand:- start:521 stop:724 length:204 start_codon:yes stop_codon:yes gene_type:complete
MNVLQRYLVKAIGQLQVMKAVQDEMEEILEETPVWELEDQLEFFKTAWDLVTMEEYRQWATSTFGVE